MKKIFRIFAIVPALAFFSCDLDLYPVTSYNEGNVTVDESSESQYSTRAQMQGLRDALYNSNARDIQEKGFLDWLVYNECRADNAYCGSLTTGEIVAIEANSQDGANKNVDRDWSWYLNQLTAANQIICNIDRVKENDPTLTDKEYQEWKSEAFCWRSLMLYQMSQIWGAVPVITTIPPAITAENIEDVYDDYYPARADIDDVYERMITDLEYAVQYAPDVNHSNKFLFTKGFANGLLARIYAEKTRQDWNKVAQYCEAVEGMGYSLCEHYGDLWAYNDEDTENRNTPESIFEVQWTRSSGNWVNWMLYRNAYDPDGSYSWAKWITPSRDLIAAYQAEGDTERMNATIKFDECTWSSYYPAENYAFMNKVPTGATSIIVMRLAEIYLLHAEALTMTGKLTGEAGAEGYVNKVRTRAGLAPLEPRATQSQEAMLDAVLHERRLELALEGFRFYDLVRHGKAKEIHDAMPLEDPYWQPRYPLTDETILMPIPTTALEDNPRLVQNPGY